MTTKPASKRIRTVGDRSRLGLWPRPNWRDASAYPSGPAIGPARLTWEFVRRSTAYANAWQMTKRFAAEGGKHTVEDIARAWHMSSLQDPSLNDGAEFVDMGIEYVRPKALGSTIAYCEPHHDLQFSVLFDLSRSLDKQVRLFKKTFNSLVQEATERCVPLKAQALLQRDEFVIRKVLAPNGAAPPEWPRAGKKPRMGEMPKYLRIIDALDTEFENYPGRQKTLHDAIAAGLYKRPTKQNVLNVQNDIKVARRYLQGAYWEIQAFHPWKK